MEPIVRQSYTSRVVALFYAAMQRHDRLETLPQEASKSLEDIDEVVAQLTPVEFEELVEDVRLAAFILEA